MDLTLYHHRRDAVFRRAAALAIFFQILPGAASPVVEEFSETPEAACARTKRWVRVVRTAFQRMQQQARASSTWVRWSGPRSSECSNKPGLREPRQFGLAFLCRLY
jgi:hypothetical protein